jgi:hypothetical protein
MILLSLSIGVRIFSYTSDNNDLMSGNTGLKTLNEYDFGLAYATSASDHSTDTVGGYPFLLNYSVISIDGRPIIDHGLGRDKSVSPARLNFTSWGNKNLEINQANNQTGIQLYRISGSAGDQAAGYIAENLDIRDRYISLTVGQISKSRESQISFAFTVTNDQIEYRLIFVNGPLSISGWRDNFYYAKINQYSSILIDLRELLPPSADNNYSLKTVTIVVQKNTSFLSEFSLDSGESIGNPSVVTGHLKYDKYVFHDLSLKRAAKLEFSGSFVRYNITENGWQITETAKSSDISGSSIGTILISGEQKVTSGSSSLLIFNIDIYHSLANLGAKDLLVLIIILTVASILPLRSMFG